MIKMVNLARILFRAVLLFWPPSSMAQTNSDGNADLVAFGKTIETAFNKRQADDVLVRLIDMKALGYRVAGTLTKNDNDRKDFATGFALGGGVEKHIKLMLTELDRSSGSMRYMKIVTHDQQARPLLRMSLGTAGVNYFEFIVKRNSNDVLRIVDWYQLSHGELLSRTIGAIQHLMADPNPGLLASLFGIPETDEALAAQMREAVTLQREGKHREALQVIEKLPPAIADSRLILGYRATIAGLAKDYDAYLGALEKLARLYGDDPATALMLLDHYFSEKNLEKALHSISIIEKRVGRDGWTQLLRANLYMTLGMHDKAITYAQESVRMEPDFGVGVGYFTLAQSHVALGQFPAAIEAYRTLQSDFGYTFSKEEFAKNPALAEFIASKEFKQWFGN